MSATVTSNEWQLRPMRDGDWRPLRLLLPQAFHWGSEVRCGVAVAGAQQQWVVGAVALAGQLRSDPLPGYRVAVHVIPPERRRGIGSALIGLCANWAQAQGAAALYAWTPLDPQQAGATVAAWRALGFDQTVIVQEGMADIAKAVAFLTPYYEQIKARNWIPPEARLVQLFDADPAAVASLLAQYMGGRHADIVKSIRRDAAHPYHADLSPVLLLNDQVVAVSLARVSSPGVALVDATAVHPSVRGGWANVWLKYHGAVNCQKLGITTLLYYTYDRHTDSRRTAQRSGTTTRELVEPYRLLQINNNSGE